MGITNKTKSIKVKQNCSFKKKEEMQHFGILAMSVMVLTCLVQVHAESVPENANENLKMDVKVADVIPVADDNNDDDDDDDQLQQADDDNDDDDDDDDDNDNSLQRASAGLSICKGFCRFGCRKTCKRCSYVCKKYGWKMQILTGLQELPKVHSPKTKTL